MANILFAEDALNHAVDTNDAFSTLSDLLDGCADNSEIDLKSLAELIRVTHVAMRQNLDEIRRALQK